MFKYIFIRLTLTCSSDDLTFLNNNLRIFITRTYSSNLTVLISLVWIKTIHYQQISTVNVIYLKIFITLLLFRWIIRKFIFFVSCTECNSGYNVICTRITNKNSSLTAHRAKHSASRTYLRVHLWHGTYSDVMSWVHSLNCSLNSNKHEWMPHYKKKKVNSNYFDIHSAFYI